MIKRSFFARGLTSNPLDNVVVAMKGVYSSMRLCSVSPALIVEKLMYWSFRSPHLQLDNHAKVLQSTSTLPMALSGLLKMSTKLPATTASHATRTWHGTLLHNFSSLSRTTRVFGPCLMTLRLFVRWASCSSASSTVERMMVSAYALTILNLNWSICRWQALLHQGLHLEQGQARMAQGWPKCKEHNLCPEK